MERARPLFLSRLAAILASLFLVACIVRLAWLTEGSVVVFDRHEVVAEAFQTSDQSRLPLSRLPWGPFFAVPRTEGEIEIVCKNGAVHRAGYVTKSFHTWVEVGADCATVRELPD